MYPICSVLGVSLLRRVRLRLEQVEQQQVPAGGVRDQQRQRRHRVPAVLRLHMGACYSHVHIFTTSVDEAMMTR